MSSWPWNIWQRQCFGFVKPKILFIVGNLKAHLTASFIFPRDDITGIWPLECRQKWVNYSTFKSDFYKTSHMILLLLYYVSHFLSSSQMQGLLAEDSKVLGDDRATGWKESCDDCMAQSLFPLPTHYNSDTLYNCMGSRDSRNSGFAKMLLNAHQLWLLLLPPTHIHKHTEFWDKYKICIQRGEVIP